MNTTEVERLRADVQAALGERDQQFERKCEALRERDKARRELEAARAELADVHSDLKLAAGEAYTTAGSAAFEVMRQLAEARAAIERVSKWVTSDVVTAKSSFGDGYREAMRDVRDLLGSQAETTTTPARETA